jgi:hypothetical protein
LLPATPGALFASRCIVGTLTTSILICQVNLLFRPLARIILKIISLLSIQWLDTVSGNGIIGKGERYEEWNSSKLQHYGIHKENLFGSRSFAKKEYQRIFDEVFNEKGGNI